MRRRVVAGRPLRFSHDDRRLTRRDGRYPREPDVVARCATPRGARRYCDALKDRGILAKDTHNHTIRISPPLVITRDEVDWVLERFNDVLTAAGI